MTRVVLGLGSNKGESRAILMHAVSDLSKVLEGMRASSLYETAPQEYLDQKDFLNLAVSGSFTGTPEELFIHTQEIETVYGRDRAGAVSKGPRTLDIDILLFGDRIIKEKDLVIPHERMNERQFVLIPLLEIEPECTDPSGVSYRKILSLLPDQGVRKAGSLNGK